PADDFGPTAREVLPTTRHGAETPLAHKQAMRAVVKGWPTLPGYEILAELGRGGMSIVYKARHVGLRRVVAIKVIDQTITGRAEILRRFHHEQLLAIRLKHPNLVAAYDIGEVAGVPYLVLEFVEGHDLAWFVRQRGPLPAAEACEVVRQAALGLQHLHKQ